MNPVVSGKDIPEVIGMAKQGMKRIERTHTKSRNEMPPVPEIQGRAKHGNASAGEMGSNQKISYEKGKDSRSS